MLAADVTAVTAAFQPVELLDTFILFAPYIMAVAGILIGAGLITWGIRSVRRRLSGGVA